MYQLLLLAYLLPDVLAAVGRVLEFRQRISCNITRINFLHVWMCTFLLNCSCTLA